MRIFFNLFIILIFNYHIKTQIRIINNLKNREIKYFKKYEIYRIEENIDNIIKKLNIVLIHL